MRIGREILAGALVALGTVAGVACSGAEQRGVEGEPPQRPPPRELAGSPPEVEPTSPLSATSSSVATAATTTTGSITPSATGGVTVLSVTDGDTIRVLTEGANEPLRLIGINAPEEGECLAVEATRRLAELIGNRPVRIESDVSDRDDFGRLLRYVHADEVFVNQAMVREGLALARRYDPDTARADELEAAQAAAESDGTGMWDPGACGVAARRGIQIDEIHYDAAGDDNLNLNDEWVEFSNSLDDPIDLTGWSVKDESASHRYTFPSGFELGPGATVRLHTGCGHDTSTRLYWCEEGSAVWNNSGDTVFVLDSSGNIVVSRGYPG